MLAHFQLNRDVTLFDKYFKKYFNIKYVPCCIFQ